MEKARPKQPIQGKPLFFSSVYVNQDMNLWFPTPAKRKATERPRFQNYRNVCKATLRRICISLFLIQLPSFSWVSNSGHFKNRQNPPRQERNDLRDAQDTAWSGPVSLKSPLTRWSEKIYRPDGESTLVPIPWFRLFWKPILER